MLHACYAHLMPLLPTGPARRTTIIQLIGFIAMPIVFIMVLLGYALYTINFS